jgi:hypothetical protein
MCCAISMPGSVVGKYAHPSSQRLDALRTALENVQHTQLEQTPQLGFVHAREGRNAALDRRVVERRTSDHEHRGRSALEAGTPPRQLASFALDALDFLRKEDCKAS